MQDEYAAGIIDGEGCIRLMTSPNGVVRTSVEVTMSYKALPLLTKLQAQYGGNTIHQKRDDRTQTRAANFSWRKSGLDAIEFLRLIRPHLIIKAEQADLAIWLFETIASMPRGPGKGTPWSAEAKALGMQARERMAELNRTGPERRGIPGRTPFAIREGSRWVTPQRSLLEMLPAEFTGPWPKCGVMIDGLVYELQK